MIRRLSSIVLILICSCNSAVVDEISEKEQPEKEQIEKIQTKDTASKENAGIYPQQDTTMLAPDSKIKELIGYYVGEFKPDNGIESEKMIVTGERIAYNYINKINISLDSFSGNQVFGHSVVAGNDRPFKGTYKATANEEFTYDFEVKEPGDHSHDGIFVFTVRLRSSNMMGTWKAYKKVETPIRKFDLTKMSFVYNPEFPLEDYYIDWDKTKKVTLEIEGEIEEMDAFYSSTRFIFNHNSSAKLLTKKEVENMTKADLFILRNSIYARHGYSFKKRQLRAYFDKQKWYLPLSTNIKSEITEIERKNIELILRYEEHAEAYYDEFGRG